MRHDYAPKIRKRRPAAELPGESGVDLDVHQPDRCRRSGPLHTEAEETRHDLGAKSPGVPDVGQDVVEDQRRAIGSLDRQRELVRLRSGHGLERDGGIADDVVGGADGCRLHDGFPRTGRSDDLGGAAILRAGLQVERGGPAVRTIKAHGTERLDPRQLPRSRNGDLPDSDRAACRPAARARHATRPLPRHDDRAFDGSEIPAARRSTRRAAARSRIELGDGGLRGMRTCRGFIEAFRRI